MNVTNFQIKMEGQSQETLCSEGSVREILRRIPHLDAHWRGMKWDIVYDCLDSIVIEMNTHPICFIWRIQCDSEHMCIMFALGGGSNDSQLSFIHYRGCLLYTSDAADE